MALEAIFAIDDNLGFGRAGALPWPFLKEDMEHFKKVTKDKKLIMGRNTFKSLPIKPTKSRPFHVLSRFQHMDSNPYLDYSSTIPDNGIIIGGASLLNHTNIIEKCSKVYVTRIKGTFSVDTKIESKVIDYLDTHFHKEMLFSTKKCTVLVYTKDNWELYNEQLSRPLT